MTEPAIIANMSYVSTKRNGRGTGHQGLRGKLRYFQYRDDRNRHIQQDEDKRRWYDRGLGKSYSAIFKNCLEAESQTVAAWTWVVSPSPHLMALIPQDHRHILVAELTDNVVEAYYEARDLPSPSYSFVIHDRDTKAGEQQVHSHVVLTGMVYDELEQKATPVFNAKNKGHMTLLDQIANRELAMQLDRLIGPEWRLILEEPPEPTVAEILSTDLAAQIPQHPSSRPTLPTLSAMTNGQTTPLQNTSPIPGEPNESPPSIQRNLNLDL